MYVGVKNVFQDQSGVLSEGARGRNHNICHNYGSIFYFLQYKMLIVSWGPGWNPGGYLTFTVGSGVIL
jgi:hypothetical protein